MTGNLPSNLEDALGSVKTLTAQRLQVHPQSPFYEFAMRESARIEERLRSPEPIDEEFYESLNIGLMCARELEITDMDYCDHVYRMLTLIKNSIGK